MSQVQKQTSVHYGVINLDAVGEIFLNIRAPGKPRVREDIEFWLGDWWFVLIRGVEPKVLVLQSVHLF